MQITFGRARAPAREAVGDHGTIPAIAIETKTAAATRALTKTSRDWPHHGGRRAPNRRGSARRAPRIWEPFHEPTVGPGGSESPAAEDGRGARIEGRYADEARRRMSGSQPVEARRAHEMASR